MKVLVVYDSVYGNTREIAGAIGGAAGGDARVLSTNEVNPADMESLDLLIIGAPTQAGRPSPAMQEFLKKIPEDAVKGVAVAAFDTRIPAKWVGIFGYAAGRIARNLKSLGGNLIASPEGFFVMGREGPLREGEPERAAEWARGLAVSKK